MIKQKLYLFASTLMLLAGAPHALAGRPGSTPSPEIESIELDNVQHRLTITGNFLGATAPQITLGKHRLEVSDATPTQVVAALPPNLRSATYRLVINNVPSLAEATTLYLQFTRNSNGIQVASTPSPQLK